MRRVLFILMCLFALLWTGLSVNAQEVTITLMPKSTLGPGCTWISYSGNEVTSIVSALGDFVPTEGDKISSQFGTTTYYNGSWRGDTLQQFIPGVGYKYYSNNVDTVSFVLIEPSPYTVTTNEPTNITTNSATIDGLMTPNGGDGMYVLMKGFCWATHSKPIVMNDSTMAVYNNEESFSEVMTGLTLNTKYYVRAFVITPNGTAYGNEQSFTTRNGIPELITGTPTGITAIDATCRSGVTSDGGLEITARGVCWSTSNNPTVADACTIDGSGTGSFSSILTGLTPNTTYYVRAYAINSFGTWYGDEKSFTTLPLPMCTISISASPVDGGRVTGDGTYQQGQICMLTATPNAGYTFLNWTESNTVVSTNVNYSFTVQADRTLVANFTVNTYTVSVSVNPTNGGSVSGAGSYQSGQTCTLTATANSNYTFTNWKENGNVVSTNATYSFTVNSSKSLVANFTYNSGSGAPTGVIGGLFSVSSSRRVYFSRGNLQYKASTNTWRFAEHQWDYVGTQHPHNGGSPGGTVSGSDNYYISQNYSGWIDLFGWGTSGWNNGNIYYRPWNSPMNGNASQGYGYGPTNGSSYLYNLTGTYANSDWGVYNSISNGGNQPNQWRTLTNDEWNYVFNQRYTASGIRFAKAKVNNVNGVILLPNNWSASTYSLNNTNSSSANFSSNILTASQWNILEQAGAVFLPAGAARGSNMIVSMGDCYYWSSTSYNEYGAYYYCFKNDDNTQIQNTGARCLGMSVRLVYVAQ